VGRPTLVLHAAYLARGTTPLDPRAVRVGFVVGKSVGNAVTRNRVRRRLRHLAAAELPGTPSQVSVVVRALPRAAAAPQEVPSDLASAWPQAMDRLARRTADAGAGARR
jgi:ribonuclease P protein component